MNGHGVANKLPSDQTSGAARYFAVGLVLGENCEDCPVWGALPNQAQRAAKITRQFRA